MRKSIDKFNIALWAAVQVSLQPSVKHSDFALETVFLPSRLAFCMPNDNARITSRRSMLSTTTKHGVSQLLHFSYCDAQFSFLFVLLTKEYLGANAAKISLKQSGMTRTFATAKTEPCWNTSKRKWVLQQSLLRHKFEKQYPPNKIALYHELPSSVARCHVIQWVQSKKPCLILEDSPNSLCAQIPNAM